MLFRESDLMEDENVPSWNIFKNGGRGRGKGGEYRGRGGGIEVEEGVWR